MNCKEAILLMHDYLDGDVTGPEAAELKKHLIGCAGCQARYTKLEKTGAIVSSLKPVYAPSHLTTASIMQRLPAPTKKTAWMRWLRRHPAAAVAAVFIMVMLGSFMSMWNENTQLVLQGDIEQVVVKGNTVIIPEGHVVEGNLIVENGQIEVNGKINGNLIVIDGNYALASTAQISGDITSVNQAVEWIWFKVNQFFSLFAK